MWTQLECYICDTNTAATGIIMIYAWITVWPSVIVISSWFMNLSWVWYFYLILGSNAQNKPKRETTPMLCDTTLPATWSLTAWLSQKGLAIIYLLTVRSFAVFSRAEIWSLWKHAKYYQLVNLPITQFSNIIMSIRKSLS